MTDILTIPAECSCNGFNIYKYKYRLVIQGNGRAELNYLQAANLGNYLLKLSKELKELG
jgi:hypothetical protein